MHNGFVINGKPLITYSAGLKRMGRETLAEMDKLVRPGEIIVLAPENNEEAFSNLKNISVITKESIDRGFWGSRVLKRYAKDTGRRVVNMIAPLSVNRHSIIAIADVRYMEKDDTGRFYDGFKFRFKSWLSTIIGLMHADAVVTISEFSKKRIATFFRYPEERIIVIPCAWQHYERILADEGIFDRFPQIKKGEYFFTVGTLAPHKNHRWVYRAAERNPEKTFVICGGIESAIWSDKETTGNRDNLIFTGYISDGEMKALMTQAKAFIFPSLYEGFGMPPLEALSIGTECIVSDIPAHRETFGGAVHYVDPRDSDVDLERILKEGLTESKEEVLFRYSWESAAVQWMELIRGIQ